MTIDELRARLHRVMTDERLTRAERDTVRMRTIGVLNPRPRTVGEAKRLLAAFEAALHSATTEIPF